MTRKQINSYKYLSFLGIIGLMSGFAFLVSHELTSLFYTSFLAFFAYIPMYRELKKGVDERTITNIAKSNRIATTIAFGTLMLLGIIPGTFPVSSTFFVGGAGIGIFCAITTQVIAFFYYEKK